MAPTRGLGVEVGLLLNRFFDMARIAAQREVESVRSEATTIGVAAKDALARARIVRALQRQPELVVQAGASARELVARGTAIELLVFDCDNAGTHELALFTELKRQSPELLIVAVCQSANCRSARRAVAAGADGVVLADQVEAALAPTVASVLAGQTAVPRALSACARKPSLSFREKQILGMVVLGFTNREIGARLYLAESTVKSHLRSAFDKLGVRSRSEAAAAILDPQGSLGPGILAIANND
jgi:two-component system, NarL family, response regulator